MLEMKIACQLTAVSYVFVNSVSEWMNRRHQVTGTHYSVPYYSPVTTEVGLYIRQLVLATGRNGPGKKLDGPIQLFTRHRQQKQARLRP